MSIIISGIPSLALTNPIMSRMVKFLCITEFKIVMVIVYLRETLPFRNLDRKKLLKFKINDFDSLECVDFT